MLSRLTAAREASYRASAMVIVKAMLSADWLVEVDEVAVRDG